MNQHAPVRLPGDEMKKAISRGTQHIVLWRCLSLRMFQCCAACETCAWALP